MKGSAKQHHGFEHFDGRKVEGYLFNDHVLPVKNQEKDVEHVPGHCNKLAQSIAGEFDEYF